ncbi:unnamed protein product [Ectocarpus fasciculatus]
MFFWTGKAAYPSPPPAAAGAPTPAPPELAVGSEEGWAATTAAGLLGGAFFFFLLMVDFLPLFLVQSGHAYLEKRSQSCSVRPTHRTWNQSWQKSHSSMVPVTSAVRHTQYTSPPPPPAAAAATPPPVKFVPAPPVAGTPAAAPGW